MNIDWKNWGLLITLSAIWGSSFILMKLGMYNSNNEVIFSDTQVAALRMSIAGLVLAPLAIRSFKHLKNIKDLLFLTIVGFSGNFIPAFLFTYAETGLSSGYTGMLNSFTPIFALIIGISIFSTGLNRMQFVGLIVGTIGIFLLSFSGHNLTMTGGPSHILAVIFATLCYAISMNIIKFKLSRYSGIDITSMAFTIVLLPSIIITYNTESLSVLETSNDGYQSLMYIILLSIVGTAFAVYLLNILIARSSILFSSSVTYLIPVFAAIIGLGYGERISFFQILSMAIVLTGIFIANYVGAVKKA